MEMATGSIGADPESGLLMIPPNDAEVSIGVALWDDAEVVYQSFVKDSLLDGWEQRIFEGVVAGRSEKQQLLPVVVQLVPRPDNDYNPMAISVAAPPSVGGTDHERHMGYMYDRNLSK